MRDQALTDSLRAVAAILQTMGERVDILSERVDLLTNAIVEQQKRNDQITAGMFGAGEN